jgi:hypothetical protein
LKKHALIKPVVPVKPLDEIIRGDKVCYPGNLTGYASIIFGCGPSRCPRPNMQNILYMLSGCYEACLRHQGRLPPVEMRDLLIAAIFYDFGAPGLSGNDTESVMYGVQAFQEIIGCDDEPRSQCIITLMRSLELVSHIDYKKSSLSAQIIHDVDVARLIDPFWCRQGIFGRVSGKEQENELSSRGALQRQAALLRALQGDRVYEHARFLTNWAAAKFPKSLVEARLKEVEGLIALAADHRC